MDESNLAIFPLPIVLFPGTAELLHIFEPRYRQMLADCRSAGAAFGINHAAEGQTAPPPTAGSIGCEAEIEKVWPLGDGRSNILVRGGRRYLVLEYLATDRPYLVARVEPYEDESWLPEPPPALVEEVRRAYLGLTRAVNALQDAPGPAVTPPTDPAALSFHVCGAVDIDVAVKQELLALQSAQERLERLHELLVPLSEEATRRVVVHQRAKRNGRGTPNLAVEGDDSQ